MGIYGTPFNQSYPVQNRPGGSVYPYQNPRPNAPMFDPRPPGPQLLSGPSSSEETYDQHMARRRTERFGFDPQNPPPTFVPGSRSSPGMLLPPGTSVTPGVAPGMMRPPAGHVVTDPERLMPNPAYHTGSPSTQPVIEGVPNPHPVPEFIKTRGGSHVEYAPGMAPATQASSPAPQSFGPPGIVRNINGIPSDAGNYERNRAYSDTHKGTGKTGIGLNDANAYSIWQTIQNQNSDPTQTREWNALRLKHMFLGKMAEYGIDPTHAEGLHQAWTTNDGPLPTGLPQAGAPGYAGAAYIPQGSPAMAQQWTPSAPTSQPAQAVTAPAEPATQPTKAVAAGKQGARPTTKPANQMSEENINFTAQKYGITPDDVRRRLGA